MKGFDGTEGEVLYMPLDLLGCVCGIEIEGSSLGRGVFGREVLGLYLVDIQNVKRKGSEFVGKSDGTNKISLK